MDVRSSNVDFLAWFSEDERHKCPVCHDRTAVTVADARSSICLSCGAISIEGQPVQIQPEQAA